MTSPSRLANMGHEPESFALSTNSETSQEPFLSDEEDGFDYYASARPTFLQRLSSLLRSMTGLRNRQAPYHAAGPNHDLHRVKSHPAFPPHRSSTQQVLAFAGRLCYAVPLLILVSFGILHVMQVLVGRGPLFWDIDHEDFLPNWGKPGHVGEGLADYPTDATRDVIPIPCHSHNDYWRRVPLFDAIHYGCTGVEADVWLFDDDLYVGHNTASLTAKRTFRSLYVDPIIELLDHQNPTTDFVHASGHGVFDTDSGQTLTLLVDFKTDGRELFPYVEAQISGLRDKGYLTYFNGTHTIPGAVTVVGTGNTPFDMVVANETYRDIFFDAPLDKLWEYPRTAVTPSTIDDIADAKMDYGTAMADDGLPESEDSPLNKRDEEVEDEGGIAMEEEQSGGQGNTGLTPGMSPDDFNPSTSYYASLSFHAAVGFVWRGHLSARQMEIIRGQIRGAKRRGLKARYWDTPAWPISLRNHVWHVLVKEGADVLNVDDLRAAAQQDWRKWRHDWW